MSTTDDNLPIFHYTERGNAAGKTIFLIHGWPDPGAASCYAAQVPLLEKQGCWRIVLLDIPGYGDDKSFDDFPSWRPPTVDELGRMLVKTVRKLKKPGETPSIIAHDWGSIILNSAIFHEAKLLPSTASDAPLFDRAVMLDVGGEVKPFGEWGLKAFAIVLLYQSVTAFLFLLSRLFRMSRVIPESVADTMHQKFTALWRCPHAAQSRARMGYLYVYILSSPLLWGSASLMWYSRNSQQSRFSDYEKLVSRGVLYAHAAKKPFNFHSELWATFCKNGKNKCLDMPTVDHWFFLRGGPLVEEFNAELLKFLG